ncbi:MAG: transporter substrate-binding domain-containing protein [Desulfohalobiaceae bacterium]|nr:transporter substrate-binding domain-containing protein [Desulfohalobiaceae bacterium]
MFLMLHASGTALASEKPVLSAAEIDYPPFSFVNADDRPDGFSVELMRAALTAMGRGVLFRSAPWPEVRKWLQEGKVQALPLVGRTPEREHLFDFTFPYMSLHGAIVVRAGTDDIQDLEDLRGRRVAVMEGDNAEEFLRREDRGLEIRTTRTFEEALRQLSQGLHEAVVMQRLVALRLIRKSGLANLRVVSRPVEGFRQDFCFAVREGDRDTLALLNEGLAMVMADGTFRHLHAKWFAALQLPDHRKVVIGGDHNYPPFEYLDENGNPTGFNSEITLAIARELGLDIEIRLGPWAKIRQDLARGEIDAIQGMLYSTRRDLTFDFTPPYTVNHYVAAVRKGEGPPPVDVASLRRKRLVVQEGDIMHDLARKNGLEDRVALVKSQEEALRQLAAGQHDCALVARLTAMYWIEEKGWDNLVTANRSLASPGYGFAVPHNQKALLAQLGEGLKLIEKTGEYQRIRDKWLGIYEDLPPSFAEVFGYMALVAGPLLFILLVFYLWSRSLRKEVARRTADLRQSAVQFRSLVEGAPIAIFVQTEDCFAYVNEAGLRFFGAGSKDQLLGQPVIDRFHPSSRKIALERILALNQEKKTVPSVEETCLRLDKSEVPAEISAVPITYEEKNGALVFAQDISQRKASEAEQERLLLAIEQTDQIVIITDPQGTIQYVNPVFEQISGYSRHEAVGQTPRILKSGEQEESFYRQLWRTIASGRTWQGRMVNARKDGTHFTVEETISPVADKAGNIVNYVAVERDITKRLSLEAQLLQAQKMESVGRLAGGVAHDYNNMLSVIIGNTEMALDQLRVEHPVHNNLQEIQAAADRSVEITRQLLAFARQQTIAPRILDLNQTVEGMLKMLRRLIGEDIDLAWLPGEDLWQVKMDPSQVDQILANLCVNARDAIQSGGKITIETGNVALSEAYCAEHAGFTPGEYVLLAVSDNGSGMDPGTLEKAFEPFFTSKEAGRGTGLGLATVYGIVKQNQGFINVYSEPGQGTTIRIYLPRRAGAAKGPEPENGAAVLSGYGETVLVVEDEESILELTEKILHRLNYSILKAATPEEALERVEAFQGRIHLLLTDVVLPGMNGRELAEKLLKLYPELKCLYMSGYTANVIAHHGVLDKGMHFIQKPFSVSDLAQKIREVLGIS